MVRVTVSQRGARCAIDVVTKRKDAGSPSELLLWLNLRAVASFAHFRLHCLCAGLLLSKVEHQESLGTLLHVLLVRRTSIGWAGIVAQRYPSLSYLVISLLLK